MLNELKKWSETIKISWSKYTAYRLNFFLQIIGPTIVFFIIKYNLWSTIYKSSESEVIANFTLDRMLTYHAWVLITGLLVTSYTSMNLAEDIRMGRISTYLIYPFNFWEFHTASFLGFQTLQLLICTVFLVAMSFLGFLGIPSWYYLFHGLLYSLFVGFFWFVIQYFFGLLAFWLEETWMLRVSFLLISSFLSGAYFPLDVYPEWLLNILNYTPFPYMGYYPVKIFMGEVTSFLPLYLNIACWTLGVGIVVTLIWKRGLKLYTAAGM